MFRFAKWFLYIYIYVCVWCFVSLDDFCLCDADPSYADDEPVDYVGSNNSVGLKWDVSEDVSPVASQRVCIGTQSALDEVVPWVQVDR